jgi:hypothetical protein
MLLPLGAAVGACDGGAFGAADDAGTDDASSWASGDDAADGPIVVYHDGGPAARDAAHDATADARADSPGDATADATVDAPVDGAEQDSDGWAGCPTGDLTCNGQCVPNNTKNCGSCSHDCTNLPHVSGGVSCDTASGACSFPASSCAPGWADCNGNPEDGCETAISTAQNCGGCGVVCGPSDPVCQGSSGSYSCVTGCAPMQSLCNGSCVDTNTDPSDCGKCGVACPGTANGQPACTGGACGITCNAGYTQCGTACFNLATDPSNCGSCGYVCAGVPNGQPTCVNSTCGIVCDAGYLLCNGACYAPDTTHGVFVAQGGGTSSSCGTETFPCGTITAALVVVSQSVGAKNIVYVDDKSTLSEPQTIDLPAGVTIEGGWIDSAGTWTYDCNPTSLPTIQTTSGNVTVAASYSGSSTLQNLALASKSTAAAGESLYGVFASGSSTKLSLDNVRITVAQGGAGAAGSAGAGGSTGATGGCSPASDGANGAAGGTGSPGTSGYGPTGFVDTSGAMSTGAVGSPGHNGTLQPPQCGTSYGCGYNFDDGLCETGSGTQVCGGAGAAGCGGAGGGGGGVGQLGGASIGVFVYAATVTIQTSGITTSAGGAGGAGGSGGAGGAGAAGTTGTSGVLLGGCVSGAKPCRATSAGSVAGGVGGNGGNGGPGGQGGGGAGGDSYCVVSGGGATVSAGWTCTHASGGAGGAPNGTAGSSGDAKTF